MERVFGLDLLRCIAVLMVLLAHTRFLLRPLLPSLQALSIFGFLGVELFFVLSGFLIGGIILRSFGDEPRGATLLTFWIRRWFRTLPNYYLFLLINLVLWALDGHSLHGLLPYAGFLQNLAWECGAFFNESWSLAIEEWFYLLFPLLLLLASFAKKDRRFAVAASLGVLFLLSTLARVVAVRVGDPSWDAGIRKVVLYRLDALMLGVLGAFLRVRWPLAWARAQLPGLLLGGALFAIVAWSYYALNRNASFFARTWLFTLTSLAVLAFLPGLDAWRQARGVLAAGVQNVSLWSYSLYLCHLPVHHLLVSRFGDPELLGLSLGTARILGLTAAFVVLSIAVSALNYRVFERPAMNLRERFR
jgi:peptidoglycan/LPS O-acetylase OafA/YrhL